MIIYNFNIQNFKILTFIISKTVYPGTRETYRPYLPTRVLYNFQHSIFSMIHALLMIWPTRTVAPS